MGKTKLYIPLMIAISLLPISLVGCNRTTRITLDQALETVNSATTEINSFHMTAIATYPGDFVERMEFDFMSPDKARSVVYEQDIRMNELRLIGDNLYKWGPETGLWELGEGRMAEAQAYSMQTMSGMVRPEDTGDSFERLDYIDLVADEIIDGVRCEHYRGSYDFWGLDGIREAIENEADPEMKAQLQKMLETMEQEQEEQERTGLLEFWLGKDDHIQRQTRSTISWTPTEDEDIRGTTVPAGTRITLVVTATFTNFNEPVVIEAPVLE